VLARERVPQELAEALLGFSDNPYVILTLINILMLILGCFMEGMAIMILTVPVCLPVVQALGIDPVHFGVIVVMNLMVGLLTTALRHGLVRGREDRQHPVRGAGARDPAVSSP
jgi:TRAP-type C4-dicarboxylate transport system permease large subunit